MITSVPPVREENPAKRLVSILVIGIVIFGMLATGAVASRLDSVCAERYGDPMFIWTTACGQRP